MSATVGIGRIPVRDVHPVVDNGRRPAKAVTGETFEVTATVFREGHDAVAANVVLKDPEGRPGPWTPMRELAPGSDRWGAEVTPGAPGDWTYRVEAWSDPVATWRHTARIKVPAGIDTGLVLEEGAELFRRAAAGVPADSGRAVVLEAAQTLLDDTLPVATRLAAALTPEVDAVLARHPLRDLVTSSEPLPLLVERERALYGAWYEFFPRSEGTPETPHGTFRTAARRLPAIAAMGFDVVYLPPIHPIGTTHRKGRNNTLSATRDDVGVPWAIGSPEGGHDSIHPALGTLDDFDHFVREAGRHGLEIALDFALQCSPDHPWVHKHPDWFHHRPDGTIAYAENPPKKYQDIYPLAFNTPDILHAYLQHGHRPAFETRAVLAATLSPTWGIYSGYELCENTPLRDGSEEYLDSEKYQLKPRDWARAEREGTTIAPLITRLNTIRRAHPALHRLRNLRFHHTDNDALIAYSKRVGSDVVLVVANLDPHRTQEATISLDMPQLGLDWHESVPVHDELTGRTYHWGRTNYVRLEPGRAPAHVFHVRRPSAGAPQNGGAGAS
ncbi:maltotransferase domain-containing protein [Streptomyces sp. BSE6.1]|uniref:maltotransferase domain-containing protein n=1 Tax=Streptomyces sp. BSE6.1 TaxID=2605730 RepID=UPI001F2C1441|nr:maltotransferase domain-containing protein [Streptomyces sp. BSE6.1]